MPDMNALMLTYLRDLYEESAGELTVLVRRYLDEAGGDATVGMQGLMAAAVAFSLAP